LRKIILATGFFQIVWFCGFSQYWQQTVNYTIDVSLNDKDNTLDGFESIEYINHSPDTLRFIWFHLWPNAYKNDRTAYTDQSILNGDTRFYFSDKEQRGYINRLDFKVNNITAETEDHPQYIDIMKLVLPSPLLPGGTVHISTPFHVKIPYYFNRGGYYGQNYTITHWYPKPAVYDKTGWHEMPMLSQGEFYSEFGRFDVSITLPDNYAVAATGDLQDAKEKEWLKNRATFSWEPQKEKKTVKGVTKILVKEFPESSVYKKTLHYIQDNIHDFAWFADKRFIVKQETLTLRGDKKIDCYAFYLPGNPVWENSMEVIKNAIIRNSRLIGDYPYNTVTVVQKPFKADGGTEYPTITTLNASSESLLDYVIRHEVRHNWFYGLLASNERAYPWMDEGLNSYYDYRYMTSNTKAGIIIKTKKANLTVNEMMDLLLKTREKTKTDLPIGLQSEQYDPLDYNLSVYHKAALWFRKMEETEGQPVFDSIMRHYFQKWVFKHPRPEDLKETAEEVTGKNMDSLFSLLNKKGALGKPAYGKTSVTTPFNFSKYLSYIKSPAKNLLTIGPAVGINSYDKLMIGAFFTNAKLPPSRLQVFLAPLYATGSKKVNGLGKLNYSFYPGNGRLRKLDIFLNASRFTQNEFTDEQGKKTLLAFTKTVPGFRMTFREKSPSPDISKYLQVKWYMIKEDALVFFPDTIISGTDTTVYFTADKKNSSRNLGQVKLVMENNRALYPYSAELNTEFNSDFLRLAFTGNYFFNYAKGGGLQLRLFAGKFFYNGSKTITRQFKTDRYHLNMTGPDGYEDYTYSDYFIGRNRYEHLPSQQIMMRDAGVKVRTSLLADKVGKTDDWLAAVNFTTTLPDKINPLTVLPFRLPLRLFADIGTNADGWIRDNPQDRFLFDAGLQLSFFNNLLTFYFPLIYSGEYKEYVRLYNHKNRLLKTMSFTINISGFNPRKINPYLSL